MVEHPENITPSIKTRSLVTVEMARDAETAIQGHSRSSVVVPIDAAYMTSYQPSIVT